MATTDPKLILAGNTLVNGLGGLIFLGSCVVGTPLTQVVGRAVRKPDDDEPTRCDEAVQLRTGPTFCSRRCGASGCSSRSAIRLVVISQLSVDAANGVNSAISLPVIGLLVLATIVIGAEPARPPRRGAAAGNKRTPHQG